MRLLKRVFVLMREREREGEREKMLTNKIKGERGKEKRREDDKEINEIKIKREKK